ncbi:type II secretion system protein J [Paenibacillus sp. sgz500958]|uniref:type II secretion system protein J n=1 Tax=Paenibacillus sp. sgz500958 TaxID=3242475 RepID=UPI0036D28BAA
MKGFDKGIKSEEGFTLIEMIVALTLFSLVAGLISGVTMFGFRSYHKITVENDLRYEADLIMSSIITELYTYGAERVQNTNGGIELIKTGVSTRRTIRIAGNHILISKLVGGAEVASPIDVDSELGGSVISAVTTDGRPCNATTTCNSGLIRIKLDLKYKGIEEDRLEMESRFGF